MKDLFPCGQSQAQPADTPPAIAILNEIKDALPALSGLPLEDLLNIRDYLLYVINKDIQPCQK